MEASIEMGVKGNEEKKNDRSGMKNIYKRELGVKYT